ncbi:hypothetical protein DFH11DRAFT_1568945 [Phellopilus nigrolimitatus]|nr:hypothetical protein DFH11DRAFT_1568945 [Phellopilus nigrolimitatus]
MPPRTPYKTLPILLKAHKLTIFLEAPPTKTVAVLKEDALSALTSKVINNNNESDVPEIEGVEDFEICREIKERNRVPTGKFEVLDGKELVKNVAVAYESLFVRFRENGKLRPVEVTLPPTQADDDDPVPEPSSSKGKGKGLPL